MKKQNPKDQQKQDLENLLSKSAALREQHQNTSDRMDEIRRQTEEFLKLGNDEETKENEA